MPKTLIYYSWSVPKGWTKINVCKIAPLTQMTYWVAIQMLEKQKEKRKVGFTLNHLKMTYLGN